MASVRVIGCNIALVLDERLEQEAKSEGLLKNGLYLVRYGTQDSILPSMRIGTIISIGPGVWRKVGGKMTRVTVPETMYRVGMKVCIPPAVLQEIKIEGVGMVVFTNPHGIIGEVVG